MKDDQERFVESMKQLVTDAESFKRALIVQEIKKAKSRMLNRLPVDTGELKRALSHENRA